MIFCKINISKIEQLAETLPILVIVKVNVVAVDYRIFGKIFAAVKVTLIIRKERAGPTILLPLILSLIIMVILCLYHCTIDFQIVNLEPSDNIVVLYPGLINLFFQGRSLYF